MDPEADLTTVKTSALIDPNAELNPGEEFTYTITLTNNGPSAATDVGATDDLPDSIFFVEDATGECVGDTATAGALVTCTSTDTVAVDATRAFTFTVRLDPAFTGDQATLVNTASGTSPRCPDGGCLPSPPVPPPGPAGPPIAVTTSVKTSALIPPNEELNPGEEFTYTVTVTNTGPSVATNVGAVDDLPDSIFFVSGEECEGDTETAGVVVTCTSTDSLAPDETRDFTFTARLDSAFTGDQATLLNTAHATSPECDQPGGDCPESPAVPPPGPAGPPQAELSITKTAPDRIVAGTESVWTIIATNDGPSDAVDAVVADELPDGLTFVSDPDGICEADDQEVVTCQAGTIPAGESVTIPLTTLVDTDLRAGTVLENSASIDTPTECVPVDCPIASDPIPGPESEVESALVAEKTVTVPDDGDIRPGDEFDYVVTVTNNGPSDATAVDVTVSDPLPSMLSFVDSVDGCEADGQQVICPTLGELPFDESATFTFTVLLDPVYTGDGSDIVNTARVDSPSCPDGECPPGEPTPLPADAFQPAQTDLEVTAVADPTSITVGDTSVITVTATNNGPQVEPDAVVTDPIEEPLTYVSDDATQGSYDAGTGDWTVGQLDPGQSETLEITVRGVMPGSLTVPFTIDGLGVDPDMDNNDDEVTIIVNAAADLPDTGSSNVAAMAGLGALLLLLGGGVAITRRRRAPVVEEWGSLLGRGE